MISYLLKWFAAKKRPVNDCPECVRLNRDEADAAAELVAADVSAMEDINAQSRRMSAESRWRGVREQLAAHRAASHPGDYKGDLRSRAAKNPSPGSRPGTRSMVSTTVAPDVATTS